MISHFQWKELKNNLVRSEWAFSFFHEGHYYTGTYFKDGSINWNQDTLTLEKKKLLEPKLHDLMLFHVYENH
ncbi:DUF5342 family protein [Halalkalibacter akibai]|uniref:YheE n=1 Tax=Halalkalibacter akibai (strain ATCC 43226 / DSM 21942 / CIP 109018 / JCM 9157 / 1139) TaxID=1236973 RepID=W4QUS5_HALA3|nr:DUF5342 family protein [Halalkalibacter akibai]GAE35657.1 hypothetical protein JCM9157_2774 [Halalkalibacter akibai JCM 9157]